jgi:hypothetical protein
MAISYDGVEYTIDQPTDNALNLLNYINGYLTSVGSTVQYIVNAASPVWLIILGLGYMLSIYQKLVYAAGQAFSIADCSNQQLLNLMEIGGTAPLLGSATTITCNIVVPVTGICHILKTLTATVQYEGDAVIFSPIYALDIPAGTTGTVILQANSVGPMYIPAGAITAFDIQPANITSITSLNSAPGKAPETFAASRVRLQTGNKYISGINACIVAIRSLTGIQTANLYFNDDLVTNLVIETMTIPPRCCGMFVQGYSDNIADTYFTYMNAPCVGGTHSQNFITQSNQSIPLSYSLPNQVNLYLKVKVQIPASGIVPTGYRDIINALLLPASNSLLIGAQYTQKYLQTFLSTYYSDDITIIGVSLSMDNITFSDTTGLLKNQIGIIIASNISYTEIQ